MNIYRLAAVAVTPIIAISASTFLHVTVVFSADCNTSPSLQVATDSFHLALAREYAQIAELEAHRYDWSASWHFDAKAEAVSKGAALPPEPLDDWDIDNPDIKARMVEARQCLTLLVPRPSALGAQLLECCDTMRSEPVAAAHAQGRFDCWVEGEADADPNATGRPCEREFVATVAYLVNWLRAQKTACGETPVRAACAACSAVLQMSGEACPDETVQAANCLGGGGLSPDGALGTCRRERQQ